MCPAPGAPRSCSSTTPPASTRAGSARTVTGDARTGMNEVARPGVGRAGPALDRGVGVPVGGAGVAVGQGPGAGAARAGIASSARSSAYPSGTPHPVTPSHPGPGVATPFPGPIVISRNTGVGAGVAPS